MIEAYTGEDRNMTDLARTDVPASLDQLTHMANLLAESSLLPGPLRRQPANVAVILMGARALDVPAFWALQSMHVIDGKLTMSADLMRALVIRAGHTFRIRERTAQRAVVEITRRGETEPYVGEFSWEDAQLAELVGKGNWKKYPKAMLVARATAMAVRDHCADVLFGVVYTPDELGADTDEDGIPLDAQVVDMPTPEAVTKLAFQLSEATMDNFRAVWEAIVGMGWALEKIPDGGDMSLADHAADCLYVLAKDRDTPAEVREVWKLANGAKLLTMQVKRLDGSPTLGEWLPRRTAYLVEFAKAKAKAGETVFEPPAVKAEEIDTDNAQKLRAAAAESWADNAAEVIEGTVVDDHE